MKAIFKDAKRQAHFEKNGFVKVALLDAGQVSELTSFFESTSEEHQIVPHLHHTTTDTANPELIHRVDKKIKSVLLPRLNEILTDFNPLVGCFHIKEPSSGSETGIHQDPTFVDEEKYCSANVWVALQDIDKANGNLFFVRGSNSAVISLRVTPQFPSYYESFTQSLPDIVTHVALKKGEAVIFNNATIHGATENLSDKIRLAATLLVCSAPAEWTLYYHEKGSANDKIEKYHLDLETFISIPKNGRPDSKAFREFVSYEFPQITRDEFLKRVGNYPEQKKNFLRRLWDAFTLNTVV